MSVQVKNDVDKARNRADRGGIRSAAPSAMFEKGLRAFEIGDLSFADLQSSLTRLLKDGAPAEELLRVLRRRESIEPLPVEARDEIIAALHEAMPAGAVETVSTADQPAHASAESTDVQPSMADEEPDTSAMSRLIEEFTAAWETEPKARPAPAAAATPKSDGQPVDHKAMRRALGQREDDLAALQAEHSRVLGLLEARARSAAQLQDELHELSGQFDASRAALQLQQSKTREIEEVLAERISAEEAARMRSEQAHVEAAARLAEIHQRELSTLRASLAERDSAVEHMSRALAGRDGVIEQARTLLAERDAQIAALQGENARLAPTLESRAADKDAAAEREAAAKREAVARRDEWADKVIDLQRSLDERDAAIEAQKLHHAKIVGAFMARAKTTETELKAARERIEALASELQSRDRAAAAAREPQVAPDRVPILEQTQELEFEPPQELAKPQELAPQAALEHTLPLQPRFSSPPPLLDLRRDFEIGEFSPPPPPTRAPTGKPSSIARTAGICAALLALAVVGWVAVHHGPTAAKLSPEVAAASSSLTPGTVIRDCPTCPSFTVLPAGRFKQGSADGSASATVRPLHWVAIKYPFAMSTSAVTVDQFRAFIMATGRDMQGCDTYDGRWRHQAKGSWQNPGFEQGGTHPVTCASWSDATAYAKWLSEQTGQRYRLPSASEWEYAARGGGDAVQPWSANGADACASANVADLSAARRFPGWVAFACNDGYVFTAPVGSFKANAFGLNDMLGNVFQWTADCWSANYKGAPVDGSARTDGNCTEHELRGGSWFSSPGYVRADYRNHFAANYRASSAGIRLVREIAP